MKLEALVGTHAQTCGADLTLVDAARTMHAAGIGSLGVAEEGTLVGMLTERDLLRAVSSGAELSEATVGAWMSAPVQTFDHEMPVEQVALALLEHGYRHAPVTVAGRLVAIVSIKDVLAALVEPLRFVRHP